MKLIRRYILDEIFPVFVIGNFFFLSLMMLEKIVRLAEVLFTKSAATWLVMETIIFYMPSLMVMTVPVSGLLASLIGYSRLSSDSEMTAMQAIGASRKQLAIPAVYFGIFAMVISLIISLYLMPIGSRLAIKNLNKIVETVSLGNIREKELYDEVPGMLFYTNDKGDGANFRQMIVIDRRSRTVVTADEATIEPTRGGLTMSMTNGRVSTAPNEGQSAVLSFDAMSANIPIDIGGSHFDDNERLMTLREILDRLNTEPIFKFELSKRIAMPFAALIFCVLGFTLGMQLRRGGGKLISIVIALGIVFLNNVMILFGENLASTGQMNPYLAAWMGNIFFGSIALYSLYRGR